MKYVVKFCNASHRGIMNKKKLAGMAWCLLTSSTLVKKIAHLRLTMGQGGVHSTNWNPKPSSMAKEVGIKFQKKNCLLGKGKRRWPRKPGGLLDLGEGLWLIVWQWVNKRVYPLVVYTSLVDEAHLTSRLVDDFIPLFILVKFGVISLTMKSLPCEQQGGK